MKYIERCRCVYAAFFLLIGFNGAMADIAISRSIIYMQSAVQQREDVEVFNLSSDPTFIEIVGHEVHQAGTEGEYRERISDPRKSGLLVSPYRMVIPPNSRKLVRIAALFNHVNASTWHEKERVYRITVTPKVGELQAENSAVKVVIAYEILVIVTPNNAQPHLTSKREEKQLVFSNSGNSNVLLRSGRQCSEDNGNCVTLPGKRLYSGNVWQVELPYTTPVEYEYSIGLKNYKKIFR